METAETTTETEAKTEALKNAYITATKSAEENLYQALVRRELSKSEYEKLTGKPLKEKIKMIHEERIARANRMCTSAENLRGNSVIWLGKQVDAGYITAADYKKVTGEKFVSAPLVIVPETAL